MREIKFRAWDTEAKKIFYPQCISGQMGEVLKLFGENSCGGTLAVQKGE